MCWSYCPIAQTPRLDGNSVLMMTVENKLECLFGQCDECVISRSWQLLAGVKHGRRFPVETDPRYPRTG